MGKKAIILIVTLMIIGSILGPLAGCRGVINGSGNTITREEAFTNFTKLEVSNEFQVEVTRDDAFSVSITVDDNLEPYLDVRQRGHTLHISLKPGFVYLRTTQKAVVTLPGLYQLSLSGASRGTVSDFISDEPIDIELSGASSLEVINLETGNADLDISGASQLSGSFKMADGHYDASGASTIELEGSAGEIYLDLSGASEADLANFTTTRVTANISGASEATVNASDWLDANLSGASSLRYMGNPTLGRLETSGASTIRQQ